MRFPRLHLITPCCRPDNLKPMVDRYLKGMDPHPFEVRWHILHQGPEPDPFGTCKCNECLDQIRGGWFLFLSDDVLHDKSLFRRIAELRKEYPNARAIVFWGYERGQPYPDPPAPNICNNIGQVAWERDFYGDTRYELEIFSNHTDIICVNRLYARDPGAFIIRRHELLMEYNNI